MVSVCFYFQVHQPFRVKKHTIFDIGKKQDFFGDRSGGKLDNVQILKKSLPIQGVDARGSDHAPFFAKGIPVAAFFSNGPHLHYHQTGDTIFRINPDIMASIARLAFLAAFEWADR